MGRWIFSTSTQVLITCTSVTPDSGSNGQSKSDIDRDNSRSRRIHYAVCGHNDHSNFWHRCTVNGRSQWNIKCYEHQYFKCDINLDGLCSWGSCKTIRDDKCQHCWHLMCAHFCPARDKRSSRSFFIRKLDCNVLIAYKRRVSCPKTQITPTLCISNC